MVRHFVLFVLVALLAASGVQAQWTLPSTVSPDRLPPATPQPFDIRHLLVDGISDENTRSFVLQASGLSIGQTVLVPGDPTIADAIRRIYRLGLFSDVKILEEGRAGTEIDLVVRVQEVPRLAKFAIEGIKKKQRQELERKLPLFTGGHLRPGNVERARYVIQDYFSEKGYLIAEVEVEHRGRRFRAPARAEYPRTASLPAGERISQCRRLLWRCRV